MGEEDGVVAERAEMGKAGVNAVRDGGGGGGDDGDAGAGFKREWLEGHVVNSVGEATVAAKPIPAG